MRFLLLAPGGLLFSSTCKLAFWGHSGSGLKGARCRPGAGFPPAGADLGIIGLRTAEGREPAACNLAALPSLLLKVGSWERADSARPQDAIQLFSFS
mgnify:CR=1 FL=1